MKTIGIYFFSLLLTVAFLQGCGESEEERKAREQARLDSLRQAQQAEIDSMMQARQDSIAAAEAAQDEPEEKNETDYSDIQFTEDGTYIVQVGAWRSEAKADNFVSTWNERGYEQSYRVKVGNEETGDVWFRVRIGFLPTKEEAEKLGTRLNNEFGTPYWVSRVQR